MVETREWKTVERQEKLGCFTRRAHFPCTSHHCACTFLIYLMSKCAYSSYPPHWTRSAYRDHAKPPPPSWSFIKLFWVKLGMCELQGFFKSIFFYKEWAVSKCKVKIIKKKVLLKRKFTSCWKCFLKNLSSV